MIQLAIKKSQPTVGSRNEKVSRGNHSNPSNSHVYVEEDGKKSFLVFYTVYTTVKKAVVIFLV